MTNARHSSLEPHHFTERDDTLTHQVRFVTVGNKIAVSCVCRRTTGRHEKAGKIIFSHIGIADTPGLEGDRELYNDPDNHWAPFTEEDRATW